jgi:hypothetical protein
LQTSSTSSSSINIPYLNKINGTTFNNNNNNNNNTQLTSISHSLPNNTSLATSESLAQLQQQLQLSNSPLNVFILIS